MRITTLVYPLTETHILLGKKKRGIGIGVWNGFGGGVEEGESPEEGAIREIEEESGIVIAKSSLLKRGEFYFYYSARPEWNQHCHVFICKEWEGNPKETEEMAPQWHLLDQIPYDRMWADDILWLPQIILGENMKGSFWFGDDSKTLLKHACAPCEFF